MNQNIKCWQAIYRIRDLHEKLIMEYGDACFELSKLPENDKEKRNFLRTLQECSKVSYNSEMCDYEKPKEVKFAGTCKHGRAIGQPCKECGRL